VKALDVDFRTRSTPPRWAWMCVGALLLGAVAMVAWALVLQQRLGERQAELARLRAAVAAPGPPASAVVRKMPYDASAREFLALATAKWPEMLAAIESVEIVGVTPVSIDVLPAERTVRLELEFTEYADLLKYVDALNAGEEVPRWKLVQAQMASRGSAAPSTAQSTASVRGTW